MPGITGIIARRSRPGRETELQAMIAAMTREPFYTTGQFVDQDLGIYVGWACRRGSFADDLPLWNERRDKGLLYYGEDFRDPGTGERLRAAGHDLDRTEAAYLIHLFEDRGDGVFGELNGFFHGLLIDLAAREVRLFNDRFAMQRLYIFEAEDAVYFSSEAKAILSARPELRAIVPESLAELTSMGCVLGDKTLFKGIRQLPGASLWSFRQGEGPKKDRYFRREQWESQPPADKGAFLSEFEEAFARVLPRYLDPSQPMAMSLTGGLDTRMIMAHSPRPAGTFPCYTFASMYHDSFDVKVARQVARACGQDHRTIRVGQAFLEEFERLAARTVVITDGYLDVAGSVELYVNALAREVAPIRITGNFGSEVLRGVLGFKPKSPPADLLQPDFAACFGRAAGSYEELTRMRDVSLSAFHQAPWFNFNRMALEQSQVTVRSPFMDNDLLALAYRAPREIAVSDELSLHMIRRGRHGLDAIRTNRGLTLRAGRRSSRLRMAAIEFLRLAEYACDYGMPQTAARFAGWVRPLGLERLFLGRHKFYHFRTWYRDRLADYVRGILLDRRTLARPYFRGKVIAEMVEAHVRGRRNHTVEIHWLITVELIHRLLLEEAPVKPPVRSLTPGSKTDKK